MCPLPLVMPSRREAVLVVSPRAVYSTRCSEPTLPAITGPLLRPTPIANPLFVALLGEPRVEARQARPDHLARGGQRAVGVVVLLEAARRTPP